MLVILSLDKSCHGSRCHCVFAVTAFIEKQYQNLPGLMEDHMIFNDIPKMADEFASMVYKVDGGQPVALPMIALSVLANNGGLNGLFGLGQKAWEAL